MSVCIRSADVTVINAIEMCAMLVDVFWTVVYLSQPASGPCCSMWCVLEDMFEAVGGVVVVLTIPFPLIPPLHRVFPNL
jgi:hypothetical protein